MRSGRVHAVTKKKDFVLVGERAALGILRREHPPDLATRFNDPEVRCGLAHRDLVNVEADEKWFEPSTRPRKASWFSTKAPCAPTSGPAFV